MPKLWTLLADAWGVEHPGDPRRWLLRLFVLSPRDAKPWPRWLAVPGGRFGMLMAQELGVAHIDRTDEWILRLLLLPPRDAQAATWLPPWLHRAANHLLWLVGWPLRTLTQRLDHLDYQRIEQGLHEGESRFAHTSDGLRYLLIICALGLFVLSTVTPLNVLQQAVFFLGIWLLGMLLVRMQSRLSGLLIITLSLVATGRYAWWRVTESMEFGSALEAVLGWGLLLAEGYTWLIMVLSYAQSAWPLQRPIVSLPDDDSRWPSVDVFIPTYDESLAVVKPTLLAALALDWPRDKLRVWLLDDGRREEMRTLCAQTGAGYITRSDNRHAKAGNINHALRQTRGELVAIFDCDHVPVRSFLHGTVGWFLRDPNCAMVQTPHHFYSPDPFERNLGTFRRVPNEGKLFYGVVQDGNDLWNATFFCGSCAVIRRAPLEGIGGIATETVTEDAHTALRLHRRGYSTAYVNVPQAGGLATESLSAHIGQRIRWARGMAQIFRIDNPLTGPGLSLPQRLCYLSAMLHFFHGLPRLVFLTAPLAYLYFSLHVISASAVAIAVYAGPHLFVSQLANSRLQGRHRHSYWAEVYEAVLAWYTVLPTTLALINPKLGRFNVTAKGGTIERDYFDARAAWPYIALFLFNLGGVLFGFERLLFGDPGGSIATVLITLVWALYNLITVGTAIAVATETRQVRRAHRVQARFAARVRLADGREYACQTRDFSTSGVGLQLQEDPGLRAGDHIDVLLDDDEGRTQAFGAQIYHGAKTVLGVQFDALDLEQEAALIRRTFGHSGLWLDWNEEIAPDRPLSGFRELLLYGLRGYAHAIDRIAATTESSLRSGLRRVSPMRRN